MRVFGSEKKREQMERDYTYKARLAHLWFQFSLNLIPLRSLKLYYPLSRRDCPIITPQSNQNHRLILSLPRVRSSPRLNWFLMLH